MAVSGAYCKGVCWVARAANVEYPRPSAVSLLRDTACPSPIVSEIMCRPILNAELDYESLGDVRFTIDKTASSVYDLSR